MGRGATSSKAFCCWRTAQGYRRFQGGPPSGQATIACVLRGKRTAHHHHHHHRHHHIRPLDCCSHPMNICIAAPISYLVSALAKVKALSAAGPWIPWRAPGAARAWAGGQGGYMVQGLSLLEDRPRASSLPGRRKYIFCCFYKRTLNFGGPHIVFHFIASLVERARLPVLLRLSARAIHSALSAVPTRSL